MTTGACRIPRHCRASSITAAPASLPLTRPLSPSRKTPRLWTAGRPPFGDWKNYANVIAFGKALSKSGEQTEYTDWHGAGAQRSSIKTLIGQDMTQDTTCSVNACDYNRSDNLVRCVR